MTQVLLGKEVPTLKITLENDADSDPEDFEEGEISGPESELSVLAAVADADYKQVQVNRPFSEPQKSFKVYENKGGAFVTGLDLSSESLVKKLEGRATRFGLQKECESKVTQEEINSLYVSMGIDLDSVKNPSAKAKNYRLNTIHMRGVDEMSTNEIFSYFNEYGPASVEWINDSSCNVVWLDETSTARALLGMSQTFVPKKKPESASDSGKDMDTGVVKPIADQTTIRIDDILFSDDSSDDEDSSVRIKSKSSKENAPVLSMDVDMPMAETTSEDKTATPDSPSIDVPIPPGHWRVGAPHKKAKALLLRFATKDDRKLPGAEKRSHYYQKYGNPNFGGMTGLISKSRKRKMLATRTRQVVEGLKGEQKHPSILTDAGIGSGDADKSVLTNKQSRSKIRMRMYADDEEEKQERRSQAKRFKGEEMPTQRKGSVHSRLGKKFTTTQLRNYNRDPVESDGEAELQITREVKVPSRYDVWTSLAKSMAEEDADISSDRHRKKPTEDLRNSLSSRISSQVTIPDRRPPRQNKDLRSRIKEIREDSHSNTKHRSPLLLPDRADSDDSSSSE